MKSFHVKLLIIILVSWTIIQGQTISEVVFLIRQGQISEAQTLLRQIERDPNNTENLIFLNGLLSTNGDSALFYYEQLLKLHPDSHYSDDALFRLAQLKFTQGLYKSAQDQFIQILKTYPTSPLLQNCHYWIGLCHQAMGKSDSAAAEFKKTIENFSETDISQIAQKDLSRIEKQKSSEINNSTVTPATRYALQIGAFAQQTNALLRKSFFEHEGYHVDVRTKVKKGEVFYLVWVGNFNNQEHAKAMGEQLKERYGIEYNLVSE